MEPQKGNQFSTFAGVFTPSILTLILTVIVIVVACRQESMKAFDLIASIVTMFFLCTYGMINFAAFVESFGGNPSFRPRFRFIHWAVALIGHSAVRP